MIELTKRWELKVLAVCMVLLAAAAAWLLLTRPAYRIEGDFLKREDQRNVTDGWLVAQLRSPIAEHRARACLAMGRIGDVQALDLLLQALQDPIPRVRSAAAFALGELQDRETLAELAREPRARVADALLAALDDGERSVVTSAVEALGKMRWTSAFPRITQTAAPLVVTMTALIRLGTPEAIPWIAARRRSDDQDTRWAAAMALYELGAEIDEEMTRSFVNLTKDVNAWVRAAAVRGLSRAQRSDDLFLALMRMTADRDPKVRIAALHSLGALRADNTLVLLAASLQDGNPNVGIAAVEAIAALGDPRGLSLLQSLRFEASLLAYAAEKAVAQVAVSDEDFWGDLDGVPAAYQSEEALEHFAEALAIRRSPRSAEQLARLWKSAEPYARSARAAILQALAAQEIPDLKSYLLAAVDDSDSGVRRTALTLMKSAELDLCRRFYHRGLDEERRSDRLTALDAAAKTAPSPGQKSFLLAALEDPQRLVRMRAVRYLRALYGEDHDQKIGWAETRYEDEDYQRIARTVNRRLTMLTSVGELEFRLDYGNAAVASENFVEMALRGYFDGQRLVEVVPGRAVKVGGPESRSQDSPGYHIRSEVNTQPFLRGSLALAEETKDSGSGSFLICLAPLPLWDGRYTNFGRIISGDELLDRMTTETRIVAVVVP